jgi:single-stranded-DNA-specific exonuclease
LHPHDPATESSTNVPPILSNSVPAWLPKAPADPGAFASLAAHLHCPTAIAQILVSRGIPTPAAAEAFLNPALATFLDDPANDPTQLLGMKQAVARILAAIRAAEPILIYGDYDVDGTTATVLLKTTIERVARAIDPARTAKVTYHVPHRIREGYGMQSSVLTEAAASGVRLVISVDTGIRAFAEAIEARALALDLIVTDHHLPAPPSAIGGVATQIPDCLAVINPAQPDCPYPNKDLCGAAVAFKLAHALLDAAAPLTPDYAAFRTRTRNVLIPSFLKLVAIATIADSVPLSGENRTIAALGLAALANPVQPGLRALMQLARLPLDRAPTATEVGFRIAPRINAAGRMDIASDVVELLLTRDPAHAQRLAVKLDGLNQARRDSEARALETIDEELAALLARPGSGNTYPADCLILDHPDWHRGVLGILASRVVDRTGRPALVLTHADGDAHGSGRSIPGFHLLDAISAVNSAAPNLSDQSGAPNLASEISDEPSQNPVGNAPLFHRFGGHAHAVGFSLPSSQLHLLRERMKFYAASRLTDSLLAPPLHYDAELAFGDLTPDLFAWIERCAPFGIGNPEPTFLTRNAVLAANVRLIQDRHICLQLTSNGAPVLDQRTPAIPALGWSRGHTNWPSQCSGLALTQGSAIDILYRVNRNTGPYASPHLGGLELELRALRTATQPPLSGLA